MSKFSSFISVIVLFLLLSVIVVFGFWVFTPKIKTYRALKIEIERNSAELAASEQAFDKEYAHLQRLQEQERNIDIALHRHYDEKAFLRYLETQFPSLTLNPVKELQDNDLAVHELDIQAQIASPDAYYRFIDALTAFEWVAEVDGTLHFRGVEEGIATRFILKVYTR